MLNIGEFLILVIFTVFTDSPRVNILAKVSHCVLYIIVVTCDFSLHGHLPSRESVDKLYYYGHLMGNRHSKKCSLVPMSSHFSMPNLSA